MENFLRSQKYFHSQWDTQHQVIWLYFRCLMHSFLIIYYSRNLDRSRDLNFFYFIQILSAQIFSFKKQFCRYNCIMRWEAEIKMISRTFGKFWSKRFPLICPLVESTYSDDLMFIVCEILSRKFIVYWNKLQTSFTFSTNDHLPVVGSLVDKCNDYEKAFDWVETCLILGMSGFGNKSRCCHRTNGIVLTHSQNGPKLLYGGNHKLEY